MLETEFAPPDRYFTVSALIGRLRDPMKLPHPPNSRILHGDAGVGVGGCGESEQEKKRKTALLDKQRVCHIIWYIEIAKATTTVGFGYSIVLLSFLHFMSYTQALLLLQSNKTYLQEQPDTASLLALWKRISSHRTAAVFRKPVDPVEG